MHILIIGNGIAGITAARTIRKLSDHRVTVISAESDYFFSRTALMYVYMGHMRRKDIMPYETWFWEKNKINLINDYVTGLDEHNKRVLTSSGNQLEYDKLILATGSTSTKADIPGITLDGVSSLYSLQDLEYIESKSTSIQRAVISGGGLIGIELAEMFHSRQIPVTLLVRETGYSNTILPPEESEMVNHEILKHGIDLRLSTTLKAIQGDEENRVKSVITNTGEEIPCQFTGITIGVRPNTEWLKDSNLDVRQGFLVDEFLQTGIRDVYAIGDCAEIRQPDDGRRAIEPVWYTGRMMGETVAKTICGSMTRYTPGIWFNSAKFFNIEYQVYGEINPSLPPGQMTVFWKNPGANKSIRINYTTEGVIGFNLLGIRFRQVVCEKWIMTKTKIEDVVANLELALFDPEFSENYATYVRETYNSNSGKTILPAGKRSYNRIHVFLKSS